MAHYRLWTVQMAKARHLKEGIHLLDTTAKSGIPAFAPSYSNVMRYKDGQLSKEEYTELYLAKMTQSQLSHPDAWQQLLNHTNVAVACYCTPGKFCHRHLFWSLMKAYLEERGHTAEYKGEYSGPQYYDKVPEAVVSIPHEVTIVPFYGKEDVLSAFSPHGYTVKGVTFKWDEQFMMYCKAMLFGDTFIAGEIMKATTPMGCKILGRRVKPYDDNLWKARRRSIVFRGSLQKARENKDVADYLLSTGNAILVEASETDTDWGVGIAKDDPRIYEPRQWRGLNLRGQCWMDVRRVLQSEVVF